MMHVLGGDKMSLIENLNTVNEVDRILKVTPLTIRRMIKDERIKSKKIGTLRRIPESEVIRLQKGE